MIINSVPVHKWRGCCTLFWHYSFPGDRRDKDIIDLGYEVGKMFDHIIIRFDDDLRGRDGKNITDLLTQGIKKAEYTGQLYVVPKEIEAIRFALNNAGDGSFIVAFTDKIQRTIDFLKEMQEAEKRRFWSAESYIIMISNGRYSSLGVAKIKGLNRLWL